MAAACGGARWIGKYVTLAVGLVGFGLAGRQLHLPLLRAVGVRVNAVVTHQAEAVHASVPSATPYASLEDMLSGAQTDLIIITSPNHLHAAHAEAALRAGKHVVVEKPFTRSCREADELIQLASRQSLTLAVFHNRRWDSDFLTLRSLIERGQLGEVRSFQARWDRYRPAVAARWREQPQAGGGVLYDLGSHLVDQILCLFGWPDWVQADVFTQRAGAIADDGFEILVGKGALRMSLGVSSVSAGDGCRYRVYGTGGYWLKSGLDVQESALRSGQDPCAAGFGVESPSNWGVWSSNAYGRREYTPSASGCWLEFYRRLVQCIARGLPPPVTALDARDVVRLLEAALRSSQEARRIAL